jgi:hypothetical protein
MGAALDTRHRAKVRQLCDNPSGVDGLQRSFATHQVYVKTLCTRCTQWYEAWVLHDTE